MYVWANKYPRVVQTAQLFLGGYLGTNATLLGKVVSVDSKTTSVGIGNSLSPSDQCPLFEDSSGRAERDIWGSVFIPPIKTRLMAMLDLAEGEDFEFTDNDITQMPYLCGFESQITGWLSPWCDVFTDDEFMSYEYWNDMRYFYGMGVGTDLEKTVMTPYLRDLVDIFATGPGSTAVKDENGEDTTIPSLIMAFMNDGQLNELAVSSGVYDGHGMLDPEVRDDDRLFMARRLGVMRGTVALERMVCKEGAGSGDNTEGGDGPGCKAKRGTSKRSTESSVNRRSPKLSNHSTTPAGTYIRILLNEAVYPVPSCQSGPGRSCPLDEYVAYVHNKVAQEGDWMANCNVTDPEAPGKAGANFFTDLTLNSLEIVRP